MKQYINCKTAIIQAQLKIRMKKNVKHKKFQSYTTLECKVRTKGTMMESANYSPFLPW